VNGEIRAVTVTLSKGAKVIGDIVHQSLEIEAGAHLEGGVRRLENASALEKQKPAEPKPAKEHTRPKTNSTGAEATQPAAG